MRKSSFAALALIGSVALVGAAVTPAMAADEPTPKNATIVVVGGTLSIASSSISSEASISPKATVTFEVGDVTVTDPRAGNVPWTASAVLSSFRASNLEASAGVPLTYGSTTAYTAGTVSKTGTVTVTPAAAATSIASVTTIQTGSAVDGNNTATWPATLAVTLPDQVRADTYTATLTHSVL